MIISLAEGDYALSAPATTPLSAPDKKIIQRRGRIIADGYLAVGDNIVFSGLEITGPQAWIDAGRPVSGAEFALYGTSSIVNCVIHDLSGFGDWGPATGDRAGNIIYDIGHYVDGVGHGHGLYMQSNVAKTWRRSFVGPGRSGFALHAYTQTGKMQNLTIDGCVFIGSSLVTDRTSMPGLRVKGSLFAGSLQIGYNPNNTTPLHEAHIEGCYMRQFTPIQIQTGVFADNVVEGGPVLVQGFLPSDSGLAFEGNRYQRDVTMGMPAFAWSVSESGYFDAWQARGYDVRGTYEEGPIVRIASYPVGDATAWHVRGFEGASVSLAALDTPCRILVFSSAGLIADTLHAGGEYETIPSTEEVVYLIKPITP